VVVIEASAVVVEAGGSLSSVPLLPSLANLIGDRVIAVFKGKYYGNRLAVQRSGERERAACVSARIVNPRRGSGLLESK